MLIGMYTCRSIAVSFHFGLNVARKRDTLYHLEHEREQHVSIAIFPVVRWNQKPCLHTTQ